MRSFLVILFMDVNVNAKTFPSCIGIGRGNLLFGGSAVKEFLVNDQVHILVLSARKMYSHLYIEYFRVTWKLLWSANIYNTVLSARLSCINPSNHTWTVLIKGYKGTRNKWTFCPFMQCTPYTSHVHSAALLLRISYRWVNFTLSSVCY